MFLITTHSQDIFTTQAADRACKPSSSNDTASPSIQHHNRILSSIQAHLPVSLSGPDLMISAQLPIYLFQDAVPLCPQTKQFTGRLHPGPYGFVLNSDPGAAAIGHH